MKCHHCGKSDEVVTRSDGPYCLDCGRSALRPSDETTCSASLAWKPSGPEWQAEVHSEFQYVVMEVEGSWHSFLFLGSKYKRGHTIATDFDTADEAKQKCQDHYESLLPQNAGDVAVGRERHAAEE